MIIPNLKDVCGVKVEEEVLVDVQDDGSSLVPKSMAEEEEKLLGARFKEDEVQCEEAADLSDTQFNKLDELLTQTKLYSEFLLEKMDDITLVLFCFNFLCISIYCSSCRVLIVCSFGVRTVVNKRMEMRKRASQLGRRKAVVQKEKRLHSAIL